MHRNLYEAMDPAESVADLQQPEQPTVGGRTSNPDLPHADEVEWPPWPLFWPQQNVVELDNLGDCGAWLAEHMPEPEDVLEGDDEELVEALADAYVQAAEDMCFPLPSEFGATEGETLEMIRSDFMRFITHWRESVMATRARLD